MLEKKVQHLARGNHFLLGLDFLNNEQKNGSIVDESIDEGRIMNPLTHSVFFNALEDLLN